MSKRYTGNFISGTPQVPTLTSNNGVFDIKDVYTAVNNGAWQEVDGIYEIPKSLRFRSGSSTYLSRAAATTTNSAIKTISFWAKISNNGVYQSFFASNDRSDYLDQFTIDSSGNVTFLHRYNNSDASFTCNQLFRDPSAWYHFVVVYNAPATLNSDRVVIYVNGVRAATTTSGTLTQSQACRAFSENSATGIGQPSAAAGSYYYNGYMAEFYHIDGQALDPSYFGYFDPVTNIWQPKKYTGSYGSQGFYLPFSENGSTAQLGKNFGNGSNYITYSEQFNNGNWSKPAAPVAPTISTDATTAPDGTTTADAVVYSGSTTHPCYQEYTPSGGIPYGGSWTASMYVKQATGTTFALQCTLFNAGGVLQDGYNNFTFDSATKISSVESGSFMKVGSQYIGNGWHRVWATNTNVSGSAGTYVRISIGQRSAPTAWSIYCWGAQLHLGTTLLPYTVTTSSPVITDWTPNNFSLTAGSSAYDSMVDSPTNVFTSATDVGGVVPGNYPTWNPLIGANYNNTPSLGSTIVSYSNANLTDYVSASTGWAPRMQTIATFGFPTTGKWYWEVTGTTSNTNLGICKGQLIVTNGSGSGMDATVVMGAGGGAGLGANVTGTFSGTAVSYTSSDIIGLAFDADTMTLSWYKNNTYACSYTNITYTGTVNSSQPWIAHRGLDTSSQAGGSTVNFGQRPFAYAPPAGYKSLNTTNIQALGTAAVGNAAIQPNKWFDIVLSAGNTTGRTVSGMKFQPDLVAFKGRDGNSNHRWSWFDSQRGVNNHLTSQGTGGSGANAEVTSQTDLLTSFNSDGFSVGADAGLYGTNGYNERWVQWCWKQSPTSGLNIVKYTGDGTSSKSISHNLGVKPSMIITKNRDASGNWQVEHVGLPDGRILLLNDAQVQSGQYLSEYLFYQRTSSNFYVGSFGGGSNTNNNGQKYIAYLFAEVPGFSKFGSYTGNGSSDGPFVYTGFRPRFIMYKAMTGTAYNWGIYDTARDLYNPVSNNLAPNTYDADSSYTNFDILSNGFKARANGNQNESGSIYVYAAFAESPFALNNRAR